MRVNWDWVCKQAETLEHQVRKKLAAKPGPLQREIDRSAAAALPSSVAPDCSDLSYLQVRG